MTDIPSCKLTAILSTMTCTVLLCCAGYQLQFVMGEQLINALEEGLDNPV